MPLVAVIDFETTGLSPTRGDRAIEIAVVLLEGKRVVDRFQSLMNASQRIPAFIEALTGITNNMLISAPQADSVMRDASRFVGSAPLVAHNAAFDRAFWNAELIRVGLEISHMFACTMLVSRRLYPQAPSHKLGALVDYHGLPRAGRAHRALADAEMAATLLCQIFDDLRNYYHIDHANHALLMALQRCSKPLLRVWMAKHASIACQ